MKRPFDKDSLEQLFREIDEELSEPLGIHLVVVGGAALIFAGLNRATEDVDSVMRRLPDQLREAIRVVAERHGLPESWFDTRPWHLTPRVFWRFEYRPIFEGAKYIIYRPDLTYILVMKLYAARDKDVQDVLWLMRQTGRETSGTLEYLVEEAYGQDALDDHVKGFIRKVAETRENELG